MEAPSMTLNATTWINKDKSTCCLTLKNQLNLEREGTTERVNNLCLHINWCLVVQAIGQWPEWQKPYLSTGGSIANKHKICHLSFVIQLIPNQSTGGQWYSDTSPFSIPCKHLSGTPIYGKLLQTCLEKTNHKTSYEENKMSGFISTSEKR